MTYPCHCCGFLTLTEAPFGMGEFRDSQTWEICKVCFWEDDDWLYDPSGGGANHVGLSEARANFKRFGAIEERLRGHTRPPLPSEYPANPN